MLLPIPLVLIHWGATVADEKRHNPSKGMASSVAKPRISPLSFIANALTSVKLPRLKFWVCPFCQIAFGNNTCPLAFVCKTCFAAFSSVDCGTSTCINAKRTDIFFLFQNLEVGCISSTSEIPSPSVSKTVPAAWPEGVVASPKGLDGISNGLPFASDPVVLPCMPLTPIMPMNSSQSGLKSESLSSPQSAKMRKNLREFGSKGAGVIGLSLARSTAVATSVLIVGKFASNDKTIAASRGVSVAFTLGTAVAAG